MKAVLVISLLIAVVTAANWNANDNNGRGNLIDRDGKHQKFILNLVQNLHQDLNIDDFMKYSHTIDLEDKGDYKDLNKVYTFVNVLQNGWFTKRNRPFSVLDRRNIVTTKVLFDFFTTMKTWNTVAKNLIWCRRHLNEYQFWNLLTLLQTHHKLFDNIVLPAMYEVIPTQFFTGDVLMKGYKGVMDYNFKNFRGNRFVVMQNFTNGALGSNKNDDNDNKNDLNDIKFNKINDWNTLKRVVNDIKNMQNIVRFTNTQNVRDQNKDIKTRIDNNMRQINQGNKFNNYGEDRVNYFRQDMGLNNFFYFERFENSRIVNGDDMYNNYNNRENFLRGNNKIINNHELVDKVNRRGERYLYLLKQLLARFNLERLSNNLDTVKQIDLDGTVENGVFPNLRFTNGLQMTNRMNNYQLGTENDRKLINMIKDFETRYTQAIDQGFVLDVNGNKINLESKNGIEILGNMLHENMKGRTLNNNFYRPLEMYYRVLLGGNYIDTVDRDDMRFQPTVMGHHETTLRDPVYWQIIKRVTKIVDQYKDKLLGYQKDDVDFKGVKINKVTVDNLITKFKYFDADITNGFDFNTKKICRMDESGSSESDSNSGSDERMIRRNFRSSTSDSDSGSSESGFGENGRRNRMNRRNNRSSSSDSDSGSNETGFGGNGRRNRMMQRNNRNSNSGSDSGSDETGFGGNGRRNRMMQRNNRNSHSGSDSGSDEKTFGGYDRRNRMMRRNNRSSSSGSDSGSSENRFGKNDKRNRMIRRNNRISSSGSDSGSDEKTFGEYDRRNRMIRRNNRYSGSNERMNFGRRFNRNNQNFNQFNNRNFGNRRFNNFNRHSNKMNYYWGNKFVKTMKNGKCPMINVFIKYISILFFYKKLRLLLASAFWILRSLQ
jgi:Hemocyanin, copper containing domain/Hemocyanin, all-alpha domain/Hemocyanin, ig-like domain